MPGGEARREAADGVAHHQRCELQRDHALATVPTSSSEAPVKERRQHGDRCRHEDQAHAQQHEIERERVRRVRSRLLHALERGDGADRDGDDEQRRGRGRSQRQRAHERIGQRRHEQEHRRERAGEQSAGRRSVARRVDAVLSPTLNASMTTDTRTITFKMSASSERFIGRPSRGASSVPRTARRAASRGHASREAPQCDGSAGGAPQRECASLRRPPARSMLRERCRRPFTHLAGHTHHRSRGGRPRQALSPGKDPGGIIVTMALGVAGSFLAGFLGRAVGLYREPGSGPGAHHVDPRCAAAAHHLHGVRSQPAPSRVAPPGARAAGQAGKKRRWAAR